LPTSIPNFRLCPDGDLLQNPTHEDFRKGPRAFRDPLRRRRGRLGSGNLPAARRNRAPGRQLAWLSSRAHEIATSEDWRRDLEAAEAADRGDDPKLSANLREMRREFDRATRLPVELVSRESAATSLAKHAWADARRHADFASFAPHLETLLGIAREKADLWGYSGEPYDALLESYERRTCTAAVAELFDAMKPALRDTAAKPWKNPPRMP
jgi:Zn-dependent M32 family carboxypeptidase